MVYLGKIETWLRNSFISRGTQGENLSNLKRTSKNDGGHGGLPTWGFFCVDIGSTRRIGRDGEPSCDGHDTDATRTIHARARVRDGLADFQISFE